MQRVSAAAGGVANGAGKLVYQDLIPGTQPGTELLAVNRTTHQEELAALVEGFGGTLNPALNNQCFSAVWTAIFGQVQIIATGGTVNLTGSEAACGIIVVEPQTPTAATTPTTLVFGASSVGQSWRGVIRNDTLQPVYAVCSGATQSVHIAPGEALSCFTDGTAFDAATTDGSTIDLTANTSIIAIEADLGAPNGAGTVYAQLGSGGQQGWFAPVATNFTVPAGVSVLRATVVGAGGGGGGAVTNSAAGGGGGGAVVKWVLAALPGQVLAVAVGAGGAAGAGGASPTAGGAGATSSFGGVSALGGAGGGSAASAGAQGAGGNGGAATASPPAQSFCFGGGNGLEGQTAVASGYGGAGGSTVFFGGGTNGAFATGVSPNQPGAGGGGAANGAGGGAGAAGCVILEW